MNFTKKMALVPPELLNTLKAQQQEITPTLTNLVGLDDEMQNILQSTEAADTKFKKYQQALKRYLFFKEEQRQPISISIAENPETLNPLTYLDSLPKTSRRPARTLIGHLNKNKDINWNVKGELIVRGQRVLNSNILDLIDYTSRNTRKAAPPEGYDVFLRELLDSNVPMSAVVNTRSRNLINPQEPVYEEEEPQRTPDRPKPYETRNRKGRGFKWISYGPI